MQLVDYYEIIDNGNGSSVIKLTGDITQHNVTPLLKKLVSITKTKSLKSLTIDLDQVVGFDDFGALLLVELRESVLKDRSAFKVINAGRDIKQILSLVNFDEHKPFKPISKKRTQNIIIHLGETFIEVADSIRFQISMIGSIILCFSHGCRKPSSIRWGDTIDHMEKIGVDALPIVSLISFLLGFIIAFMSSLQLQQFGANIYVASLVALAMASELGPIMTAIVVAGRSGSAFAAELSTMQIYEEIDALFIMGFNPTHFLVIPRLIAAVIVVPLLTIFSSLFGIAGGLVIGITMLGLTPQSYMSQTFETLTLFEVVWGIFKSMTFAMLISWIGCFYGFRARGGADSVGNAATSAVVSSIFFIILFDSIFAVIRSYW